MSERKKTLLQFLRNKKLLWCVGSLLTTVPLHADATSSQSVYSFDDMTVNANSTTLPQSSSDWTYSPNTDYGNDNLDRWTSNVTGDGISRYQFAAPGDDHIGFAWGGYLEIDNKVAMKGNSLKINITGGYNDNFLNAPGGLFINNKAEYLANTKSYTNAIVGYPYIYFPSKGFSPNSNSAATPFAAAKGATAFTFYGKAPAGTVDGGRGFPEGTWQLGPFSACPTCGESGHFYNTFYIALDGWVKIQMGNNADWNNSGYAPTASIPGYVANIHGFYFTYGDYNGQFMTPNSYWLDEMQFETDTYTPQNQETLYDLAVGYEPSSNTWQIGFSDKYGNNNGGAMSSYQTRYSFSPITNENWANAIPVHVLAFPNFGLEDRTDGSFQKANTYAYRAVWAKFKLASAADDSTFQTNKHIYFAVKDISQNPSNLKQINPALTGALSGQGRDYAGNPSLYTDYADDANNLPYIKRIDYVLPGVASTPPDTTPPAAPMGLAATSGNAQAVLNWTANKESDLAGYNIYRSASQTGTYTKQNTSLITSPTYTQTGLTNGTVYWYEVTAVDTSANESGKSAAVSVTPTAPSSGKTYYVSPTGKDSNAGSSASPWLTIQNFGNVAQAGDTLIIRAGTYDGFIFGWDGPNQGLYSRIAGTSGNPITIEADPAAATGSVIVHSRSNKTNVAVDLEPGCNYVNIVGLSVTNADGSVTKAGIKVAGSTGNQILNNTVNGVGGVGGIFVDNVTNVLIANNTVNNTQGSDTTGHGMYLSGSSSFVTVTNNLIENNQAVGIHFNGDVSEGGVGVVSNVLIANNFIMNNASNGLNADGLQHSVIENNVIYLSATGKNGIALYQIDAYGGSIDNVIVNNTIVNNGPTCSTCGFGVIVEVCGYDNQSSSPTPSGCQKSPYDTSTGNIVFNNILIGNSGAMGEVASDDLILSNNITSNSSTLFVNAAGNDYHLAAGSPAIDKGVASFSGKNAPTTDIAGGARPFGSAFDIGAYEFGSSVSTPTDNPPAAPTGLTATPGNGQVQLRWNANTESDLAGYVVYWSLSASGPFSAVNTTPTMQTTYTHTGLVNGTPYYYQVAAVDQAGQASAMSATVMATPVSAGGGGDTTPPAVPSGLIGTPGNAQASLSWTADTESDLAGYNIYQSNSQTGTYTKKNPSLITSPAYTQTGLTNGTVYWYEVTAVDTSGNESAKSAPVSVMPAASVIITNNPPTVATAAKANPNPVTAKTAALTVLGADDGGEPNLTYTWSTTGTPPAAVTFSAKGTNAAKSVTATFSKAGTYSLQVSIKDAGGLTVTSNVSVTVNQTLTSVTVAPSVASVKTATTQTFTATGRDQFANPMTTQSTFAWTVAGGGTIGAATGLFTAGSTVGGPFTVTGAAGAIKGTAAVTVTSNAPPTVNLTSPAANSTFQAPATIAFSATASDSDGTVSKVEFFQGTTLLGQDTSSPYSYTWNNVAAGNYELFARATDNLGGISESAHISVSVTAPVANPDAAPTGLTATPGNGQVQLHWNANAESDLAGYVVYWSLTASGPFYAVNTTPTMQTTYTHTGLVNGTPYYYQVAAVDQAGQTSAVSATVMATPVSSGGGGPSPENGSTSDYSVTPNPCAAPHCTSMVCASTHPGATVDIYTKRGKRIFSAKQLPFTFSTDELASGLYLAVFHSGGSGGGLYGNSGNGAKIKFAVVR